MYSVLLADDSEDDRLLFEVAIARVPSLKLLATVADGIEAMWYLEGQGEYGNRQCFPLPDMLFLDFKMPRMGGLEVLQWLQTRTLKPRVIVLSGSDLISDRQQALALGADDFRVKPNAPDEMVSLLESVVADARSHHETQRAP